MFKNFKELCNAVEKIDRDAAEWLRNDAKDFSGFREHDNLIHCFIWADSPQGHDYWENIHIKLGGNTNV